MTGEAKTVLYQYRDPIQGCDIRTVVKEKVDDSYGAECAVLTQRRDDGEEWRTTATGYAADLEVDP